MLRLFAKLILGYKFLGSLIKTRGGSMGDSKKVSFYFSQGFGFLPFAIFVISILVLSYFKAVSLIAMGAFAIVGLIITSLFAKNHEEYWSSIIRGITSKTTGIVFGIFLVVGMFSQLMAASQISGGLIWLSNIVGLEGAAFTVFVFIASALFGTATGSSVGTIITMVPVLFPAGVILGGNPAMLVGAILSGAAFGDNIAPISDIAIISSSSQKYVNKQGSAEIGQVVKRRLKYVAIASGFSLILFALFGGGSTVLDNQNVLGDYMYPKGLIMLIPAIIVIMMAMKGKSIFSSLTGGIVSAIIVGLTSGIFTFSSLITIGDGQVSGIFVEGITSVQATIIIFAIVMAMYNLLLDSGIVDQMINNLGKSVDSPRGSELFIIVIAFFGNMLTAGINTLSVAIVAPLADTIGSKQLIHPYRRANLIATMVNTSSFYLPWSISIFIAISIISGMTQVFDFLTVPTINSIIITVFYPITLTVVMFVSVITGYGRIFENQNDDIQKTQPNKNNMSKLNEVEKGIN